MDKQVFGYVRVSTKDQNEARQLIALAEHSISQRNLYIDKQSGKDFDRPAYQKLLKRLRPGDLLIVQSIDRLGRNYEEILEQWRVITKEKRADIVILDMPLLDTRARSGDLTGTFISDLVLQILSYVAQTEREAIKKRQAEGIAAAKARGVRFGRPPLRLPNDFESVCRECASGALTVRTASQKLGMKPSSFYRYFRDFQQKMDKNGIICSIW